MLSSCESSKKENNIKKTNIAANWWNYKSLGEKKWKKAPIPSNLIYNLQRDTLISLIYNGDNPIKNQWINDSTWEYKTTIYIDNSLLKTDVSEIVFERIDTYADIYINDSLLLSTDNLFREWRINAKNILKEGNNKIYIRFYRPAEIQKMIAQENSYFLPDSGKPATRKALFQYPNNYGISYVEQNISGKVYVESWNTAKIENIEYQTINIKDSTAEMKAIFEINAVKNRKAKLELVVNDTMFFEKKIDLETGLHKYDFEFNIENYKLWWIHDLGEPYLYDINARIVIANKKQEIKSRIGIRTIKVENTEKGFDIFLNGKKLWLRTATYMPVRQFYTKTTNEEYDNLLSSIKLANFNMVRMWNGGIYEKNAFYNFCDQKGLLIWHDIMLPYQIFPEEDYFQQNIIQETTENIERLRNHPSIAFWFAENEIDKIWLKNNYAEKFSAEDSTKAIKINRKIFAEILPQTISKTDPNRQYFTSKTKTASKKAPFYTNFNIDDLFINFEITSYPNIETISQFADEKKEPIDEKMIKIHQFPKIDIEKINQRILKYYKIPQTLDRYIVASQLAQAAEIKNALAQKIKYNENIYIGPVNDYSVVVTPLPIDYYNRWKATMFEIKRVFSPLQLQTETTNSGFTVSVLSKKAEKIDAEIFVKLYNFRGRILWKKKYPVKIEANTFKQYASDEISAVIRKNGRQNVVLKTEIIINNEIATENHSYFVPPKNLKTSAPKIETSYFKIDEGYAIEFTTDKFVKDIYIQTKLVGLFDDNFFALIPGETKVIKFYYNKIIDKPDAEFNIRYF